MKASEEVKLLKSKIENMDKTLKVLISALNRAGVIEFVGTKKNQKKTLKVNKTSEEAS
ncbi:MAG: hypothetical protein ACQESP_13500 [Candidatus Muiribacteriota bacterium]